jgi:hypothetical protein
LLLPILPSHAAVPGPVGLRALAVRFLSLRLLVVGLRAYGRQRDSERHARRQKAYPHQ